jgi:hypothetical protein
MQSDAKPGLPHHSEIPLAQVNGSTIAVRAVWLLQFKTIRPVPRQQLLRQSSCNIRWKHGDWMGAILR